MNPNFDISTIILAAGQGTRMKSSLPKVLHCVAGRPMLWYAASLARQISNTAVAIVVGHGSDQVKEYLDQQKSYLDPIVVVDQLQQLGTGHAVQQAYPVLMNQISQQQATHIVILNGDTPLLSQDTISAMVTYHQSQSATVTLLTTELSNPKGYGRVVRGTQGSVCRVVEDRDASPEELSISEINVGTYVVEAAFLGQALDRLGSHNAQGEYYLTDIIEMACQERKTVSAWVTSDTLETTGINTRVHLAIAENEMRRRICQRHMLAGVTFVDPERAWIGDEVEIGQDTILYPGVIIEGRTTIGKQCIIRANSRLTDAVISQKVEIRDACVLQSVTIEEEVSIGPFAHLRPGSHVHRKAKIGNFVELKHTVVGEQSKVNHLSYIGDTSIGKKVNIGAGTITCNYDGYRKERISIEDNVFIGSDVQLIAPVTIGEGALIAAGTTITENVPPNALGISRVVQTNKEGTATRRRALLGSLLENERETPSREKEPTSTQSSSPNGSQSP